MNEAGHDQQKLRAYLVGALSADEAEIFDEMSFTDNSFAEELNAAEKDLVDAYARGELGGAELESFEKFYLASPRRREKVDFARLFQTFAATKVGETHKADEERPKRSLAELFAGWNIFGSFRRALRFGLTAAAAAALLFMLLSALLWTENRRLNEQASETRKMRDEILQRERDLQKQLETGQNQDAETTNELAKLREERRQLEQQLKREKTQKEQIIAEQKKKEKADPPTQTPTALKTPALAPRLGIASFILAPPVRGGSQIPTLSIPARTGEVAAQLQLETEEFTAFRVALVDQSNRTLWQSGRLKSKQSGEGRKITVRFPTRILKSQIYSLVVSGVDANGGWEEISSYPIRVVLN